MQAILHNIRSLQNVGSMFRTADAVGIEKIYLCGYTPTPEDEYGLPRGPLVKTALGAEKSIAWEKTASIGSLIKRLRKEGKTIYAVEQSKRSMRFDKMRLSRSALSNTVLVMGNEVKGLSPSILKQVDRILEIPMFGKKESLNVSIAFGIVAYSLRMKADDKGRKKR